MVLFTHKKLIFKGSKKQYQLLTQTAYYQAGKIVVQTILPEQPPVALITLNIFGTTCSTSADTYIPIENISNTQSCFFLESRLVSLYGGKAASLLIEYYQRSTSFYPHAQLATQGKPGTYSLAKRRAPASQALKGYSSATPYPFTPSGYGHTPLGLAEQKQQKDEMNVRSKVAFTSPYSEGVIHTLRSFSRSASTVPRWGKESEAKKGPLFLYPYRGMPLQGIDSLPLRVELAKQRRSKESETGITYNTETKLIDNVQNRVFHTSDFTPLQNKKLRTKVLTPTGYSSAAPFARTYFAGAGNNLFQSTLGNIEIQTATRLARIMVNYWNFYLLNKISLYSLFKRYAHPHYLPLSRFFTSEALEGYVCEVKEQEGTDSSASYARHAPASITSSVAIPCKGKNPLLLLNTRRVSKPYRGLPFQGSRVTHTSSSIRGTAKQAHALRRVRGTKGKSKPFLLMNIHTPYWALSVPRRERSVWITPSGYELVRGSEMNVTSQQRSVGGYKVKAPQTLLLPQYPERAYPFTPYPRGVQGYWACLPIPRRGKEYAEEAGGTRYARQATYLPFQEITKRGKKEGIQKSVAKESEAEQYKKHKYNVRVRGIKLKVKDQTFQGKIIYRVENNLCFAIAQSKNSLKICENKNSSYNIQRLSVENIGDYSQLNRNNFHLINSLQLSNLQRDHFYPNWFRLYLPDIEATEFLKNVANYYFSLGLQTLTLPSTKSGPFLTFLNKNSRREKYKLFIPNIVSCTYCPPSILVNSTSDKSTNSSLPERGITFISPLQGLRSRGVGSWQKGSYPKGHTPLPHTSKALEGYRGEMNAGLAYPDLEGVKGMQKKQELFTPSGSTLRYFANKGVMGVKDPSFTKIAKDHVPFSLLLENQIFPLNYNGFSIVEKELLYNALINSCFAKAFYLINQNRQLLDFFVDYLLRFQILRQHQILYLFSTLLLGCHKTV